MQRILVMAGIAGATILTMAPSASAASIIHSSTDAVVIPPGKLLDVSSQTVVLPPLDRALTINLP